MEKEKNNPVENIYPGFIDHDVKGFRKALAKLALRKTDIDQESIEMLNEYKEKGDMVFTSYQTSNMSLFTLNHLLNKNKMESCSYAMDCYPLWLQSFPYILKVFGNFLKRVFLRKKQLDIFESNYLENLLKENKRIIFPFISRKFFLKRYMERNNDTLTYLIEKQKTSEKSIFIVPQIIYWNRNPERTTDSIFTPGATGNKGLISGLISSLTPTHIRFLKPIDLKKELEFAEDKDSTRVSNQVRLKIMESFQADKRLILGPILKSQEEMMQKVLYNKEILAAIKKISTEDNIPEVKLKKQAYKYFKEISANFSIRRIHLLKIIVEYVLKKIFDGLSWDEESIKKIKEAAQRGPIVLCPSHKSHMDYLILSYLCYKNKMMPPHIAAGVNLSFFPLGPIFRGSGAFFLRRTFKGLKLYPYVFKQYIKTLVNESYPIEFFIEGGRTRTGRLVYPRLGFLNFLVEAIDAGYNKDLVFVPISINYDRVLEESSYGRELKGKSKKKENVGSIVKSRKLLKRKYGRVYVNADTPFSLKDVEGDNFQGDERITEVANRIIKGINKATNINPFSLVTLSMLMSPSKGFSKNIVKENMEIYEDYFKFAGVPLSQPLKEKENNDEIIKIVLDSYKNDHTVEELKYDDDDSEVEVAEEIYLLKEENRGQVAFYKNSIIHYLIGVGFIAQSIIRQQDKTSEITESKVFKDFDFFKDLFSIEFIFPDFMKNTEEYVKTVIDGFLVDKNICTTSGGTININPDEFKTLQLLAKTVQDIVESYFILFSLICSSASKKKITKKQLMTDLRKEGLRLYHTDHIKYLESLSIPNYKTAILKLKEYNYIEEKNITKKNSDIYVTNLAEIKTIKETLMEFIDSISTFEKKDLTR